MGLRPALLTLLLVSSGCTWLFPYEAPKSDPLDAAADGAPDASLDASLDAALDAAPDSPEDSGTPPDIPRPTFPWNGYHSGGNTVHFAWDQNGPADRWGLHFARCERGTLLADCVQDDGELEADAEEQQADIQLAGANSAPVGARWAWQVRALGNNAWSGWSEPRYLDTAAEGDYDGDGFPDPAAGEPGFDEGGGTDDAGRACVFSGQNPWPEIATLRLDQPESLQELGKVIAAAGDLDGNGFADVAVASDNGYVVIVKWGGTGPGFFQADQSIQAPEPVLGTGDFASSVTGAGDFDGDGFDDLAIGFTAADGRLADQGQVLLYLGHDEQWLPARPDARLESPNPVIGGRFGAAIARAGDVDGDGWADLLVAAAGEIAADGFPPRNYLCSGGSPIEGRCREIVADRLSAPDSIALVGPGDVDGDHVQDAVVLDTDGIWLFRGAPGGPGAGERIDVPSVATIAAAGDPDGDGISDLLVGFGNGDLPRVYWGDDVDTFAEFTDIPRADPEEATFGAALAAVGDVDGDGIDDVAIAAPGHTVGELDQAGGLYLYGMTRAAASLITELIATSAQQGARLGQSVAPYAP